MHLTGGGQEHAGGLLSRPSVQRAVVCLVLVCVVGLIYGQVVHHEFLLFDDNHYVNENPMVRRGLSMEGLRYAFGFHSKTYWHPVTWLSHMLDVELFGMDSGMHHLVNAFLHAVNACLLFAFLHTATGAFWPSAAAALLFAVHPLNVDSVAWLAERKNILSSTFWMLCLLAYPWYVRKRTAARYTALALLFVAGLLAKPMLVTLPFVLLLLDYWPLGRISLGRVQERPGKKNGRGAFRLEGEPPGRLLAEKVPLFVLSGASIVVSSVSLRVGGMMVESSLTPMGLRIQNAVVSYSYYIVKLLWPSGLTFYYPFPESALPAWQVIGSLTLVASVSALVLAYARRAPYLVVGWLWYLGTLVPVLGIVQGGLWPQIAERFMYIPAIGLFVCACFGARDLAARSRAAVPAIACAAAVVLVVLSGLSWKQVSYWKDSYIMDLRAIEVNPKNYVALVNLAVYLCNKNRYEEALPYLKKALEAHPTDNVVLSTLARVYRGLGRQEEAMRYLEEAARYDRQGVEARYDLGLYLAEKGDVDRAISQFEQVLGREPHHVLAHYNLGVLMAKKGRLDESERHLRTCLELKPDEVDCLNALGMLLVTRGKPSEAEALFRKALTVDPRNADAQNNLRALAGKKQPGGAGAVPDDSESIRRRLEKEPGNARLLQLLAVRLAGKGDLDGALDALGSYMKLRPDDPAGYYNAACVHAKKGEVDKALDLLGMALDKGFSDWRLIETDPDLDHARTSPRFRRLLEAHRGAGGADGAPRG